MKDDFPADNVVVLGIMVYSDATQLSGDGKTSGWPIVLSLANISLQKRRDRGCYKLLGLLPDLPKNTKCTAEQKQRLFTDCLESVLGDLKAASRDGIFYKGHRLFPLLYSYVHDYPEGCRVRAKIHDLLMHG